MRQVLRILFLSAVAFAGVIPVPAAADVVLDWNEVAVAATAFPPNSILQSRVLAIVHAAMYDAVNAIDRRGGTYAVDIKAPAGASVEAAAAAAAHAVLSRLTPSQNAALTVAIERSLAQIPSGQSKIDGINVGTEVAEKMLALRRQDGWDGKASYTPTPGPGRWQPTPPANAAGILPQWGQVTPFVLRSAAQFEIKGPPAPGSAGAASDIAEVRAVGGRNSATRTADQTAAAIFWTAQTGLPWNAAARAAAAARGNNVAENARLFALLNLAAADSQIAGFHYKYRLSHWRPVTAIRALGDPGWEPLLGTPPHPEHPSTHAAYSGAAEAVLKGFFRTDQVSVSIVYPPVFGVTRSYASFSQIAKEVDDARVWGGVHFRSADVDGRDLGRRIGEYVLKSVMLPLDER